MTKIAIWDEATELREKLQATEELSQVHLIIADILRLRSAKLHRATSDLAPEYKQMYRKMAEELDDVLIEALAMLPDNKPLYPSTIKVGENLHVLQAVIGDEALYVHPDRFSVSNWTYAPSDRRERLMVERSVNRDVQATIQALENIKADTVLATDEEEVEAILIGALGNV